ncbi:MAG: ribose-phosphate pyrophosphokinase [Alphaproteobacteria bacterium]|nr:ribose-phosphate pyrophosphokinase [Alphaproteobacteria bacterium]
MNILSSKQYEYLKNNILSNNKDIINIEYKKDVFPDGEQYFKFETPDLIKGKPAVYICGTVNNDAIFELYNIACGLVSEQCSELHIVIPYFGYAAMERADKPGEIVTAKNIARLISNIPTPSKGIYVYMLDLHAIGIQYYFENSIHTISLSSYEIMKQMISDCGDNVVLASVDMGRAKNIERLGKNLGLDTAYIMKKRISGSETEILAINADVKDKDVVIIDDMIRSGTSVVMAAKAYKQNSAKNVYVAITHGVFCNNAIEKMKSCDCINKILCTNSHVNALQYKDNDFVKIYDVSELIYKSLPVNKRKRQQNLSF